MVIFAERDVLDIKCYRRGVYLKYMSLMQALDCFHFLIKVFSIRECMDTFCYYIYVHRIRNGVNINQGSVC